ncbi:DNA polymerase theta [Echinococcus multilocularis]|uniref:DNA-directed DNA polymerase n=1 Tax=Echinococcus multilocularis TaxID=6211 RepID=A0A068YBF0_ECHMU|nr:DNA polymerase theta [Echinococcus multilocularis]
MDIRAGIDFELSSESLFLPRSICDKYAEIGITSVFPWQAACLKLPGVLDGTRNLVYCAPTSAGKTLVAELITLKRILATNKKAIIILPYVSVSREKMVSLQHIFEGIGVRVGGFMGGVSPAGGLASVRIAVCTIEKANNLINRLIEEEHLSDLGIVVVDEMHLISDQHRGYLLELLLTKLLLHGRMKKSRQGNETRNNQSVEDLQIQIVGMSAALSTLPVLGSWLEAAIYTTDFRPIPLTEFVYTKEIVYRVKAGEGDAYERLESINDGECGLFNVPRERLPAVDNDDGVFELCFDTLLSGFAALIFCSTKQWCERLATSMAGHIYRLVKPYLKMEDKWPPKEPNDYGRTLRKQLNEIGLNECLQQLERSPAGLDPVLSRCIRFGVAFHHAGLTIEERDVLEMAFRKGHLRLLIATSTLSSGVNLPARRVIIRTPFFHGQTLGYLDYKQMVGRAGRKGIDVRGESVLLCKSKDLPKVRHLLSCGMPRVTSCLLTQSGTPESSLRRALLEVIANGIVESVSDAKAYMESTLLAACLKAPSNSESSPIFHSQRRSLMNGSFHETDSLLSACLDVLLESDLILRLPGDEEALRPTQLGRAILASALGPVDGLTVFTELSRASRSVALDTDLHLVYLVTPIYLNLDNNLDWSRYLEIYQSLSQPERRVAELVGVEEHNLIRCLSGAAMTKRALPQMRRFYLALALHCLVCEDGLTEVAERFSINRGLLQSLMQQASTYAGMVTVFCNRLGWIHMERLLEGFQVRLFFGVSNELLDLIRLSPLLSTNRARILYQAGFTSIASVSRARPKEIERVLQRANPFSSGKNQNEIRSLRLIFLPDGSAVTEMELASLLTCRAQEVLQDDFFCNYGVDLPTNVAVASFTPSSKRRKLSPLIYTEMRPASPRPANIQTPITKIVLNGSCISRPPTSHSILSGPSAATEFASTPVANTWASADQSNFNHSHVNTTPGFRNVCGQLPLLPRSTMGPTSLLIADAQTSISSRDLSAISALSVGEEMVQLNDTMTFSMMERFAENATAELTLDTVSNEDIFSSQLHSSSFCEDSSKNAVQASVLLEQGKSIDTFTRRPLFSLIDVTKTPQIWATFQHEFESFLDSNTDAEIHWLAVQPNWQVLVNRVACMKAVNNNAGIVWHDGCGGRLAHGSVCSGSCLQLIGLTLSSSRLHPQTVFWLPFHIRGVDVLKVLRRLLARLRLGLIVWDLKWWLRVSTELLDLDANLVQNFHDPGTQCWLEDPDSGRPRLVDVVPDASATVNDLFSMGYCLDPPTQLCDWSKLQLANPSSPLPRESCIPPTVLNTAAQCYLLSLAPPPSPPPFALKLELPVASLLAKSESYGFVLNYSILNACQTELEKVCDMLARLAHTLVGRAFDLGSPREVADMVYNRLHLPVYTNLAAELAASKRARKSHLGFGLPVRPRQLPTNNQTLCQLVHAHPLPSIVMEWRRIHGVLEKAFSGIVRACEMALNRHETSPTEVRVGCVYRTFTATGRVVSTRPNLQAVPKEIRFSWSTLLHRPQPPPQNGVISSLKAPASVEWPQAIADVLRPLVKEADLILRPRSAFGAAKGSVLVSADFCHLELRILVHLSQDGVLLPMLQSTSQDVFKVLAAHWLNREDVTSVTDEERQQAKRLCYAIIYGMGASSLALQNGITPSEAQTLIDKFMASFHGMAEFIRRTIRTAHEQGFVRTLGGRQRKLSGFKPSKSTSSPSKCPSPYRSANILTASLPNSCTTEKAERQAVNSMIQGSAADIVKLAMRRVESALQREANASCHLVLHLHDELIYEITPETSVPEICNILRREMSGVGQAFKMKIPLPVKVKTGSNWSNLQEAE